MDRQISQNRAQTRQKLAISESMQDITLPLRQIHVAAKSVTGIQFQAYLASGLSMSCKTAFKNKKNHTCTLLCASPAQTFLLKPMQKSHSCVQAFLLCWSESQGPVTSSWHTSRNAAPHSFPHHCHVTAASCNACTGVAQVQKGFPKSTRRGYESNYAYVDQWSQHIVLHHISL